MRISPKGTLRVRTGSYELHGRIVNVSGGGAYVLMSGTTPERLLRDPVDVELRLDAGYAEWLRATGHIARIDRTGVAIAFDLDATPLRRMIDELSATSDARSRITSVILIDADRVRSFAVAAGFRAAGCSVIEAATPLEAIVRLGESSFEPDVIVVADSQTDDAQAMRTFIEREHPGATLISIDLSLTEASAHAMRS